MCVCVCVCVKKPTGVGDGTPIPVGGPIPSFAVLVYIYVVLPDKLTFLRFCITKKSTSGRTCSAITPPNKFGCRHWVDD